MVDTFGKSCKRGVLNKRVGGNFLGNLISVVHQINMLFLRIMSLGVFSMIQAHFKQFFQEINMGGGHVGFLQKISLAPRLFETLE